MDPKLLALLVRAVFASGNEHKNFLLIAYIKMGPHTRDDDKRDESNSCKPSTIPCIVDCLAGLSQHALHIAMMKKLSIASGRSFSGNAGGT